VVITDDLETPGVSRYPDAAVRAVNAGVDLLLYAKTEAASTAAHRALMAARRAGRLDSAAVRAALRRIRVLKRTLA
jgi:beta-glucosidase-like glycosyl hydrolase